jgi:flagellar protein FliS
MSAAIAASNAYRRLAVESSALGADRYQLITLLFANALRSIDQARAALARRDISGKAQASQRAISLIDEGLKGAVNREAGPLGESLFQLYDYCGRRLLHAHLKHDDAAYAEVAGLIRSVSEAWGEIGPKAQTGAR